MSLPKLTTDTIYIQGKNGFSAVKIGGLRCASENDTTRAIKSGVVSEEDCDFAKIQAHTLIRVAITVQKFWKSTGLVFQGFLGGMAFLHFVMVSVFFLYSMKYSMISRNNKIYNINYKIFSKKIYAVESFFLIPHIWMRSTYKFKYPDIDILGYYKHYKY